MGNDLTKRFDRFKPSRDIAIAVNGDFESVLTRYADLIDQATTPTQSLRLQREASRKLIRSTQVLRSEQDLMWPQTLEEHVELFVQHYPCMRMQISFSCPRPGTRTLSQKSLRLSSIILTG